MTEAPKGVSVARASGLMIAALLLSRVLGMLRETVAAWRFGQGREMDMFRMAFNVPDLLFFGLAGGALSSAFIPVFSECLHTDREEDAWKLFSVMATVMGIAVIVLVIVTEVFAPYLLFAKKFTPEEIQITANLSRIVLPAQFGFLMGGLIFGTFYARNRFLTPAMSPNIYNLGIIAGGLFLVPLVCPPISGLVWGALVGAVMGTLVIPIIVFARTGGHFRPSFNLRNPDVIKVLKLMAPVVFGLSLPGVYPILVRSMASASTEGSVAAIMNANIIMQAPLGIFGQALGLAVFPALSALAARKEMGVFVGTLQRSLRTVLFLTIPAAALMLVMPRELLMVLLGYGKYTLQDAVYASDALRMFAIGVPAWSAQAILMRGFFAMQDAWTPIILGTITTAVFVPLSWGLMHTPLGYSGLALGVSIAAVLLMVLMVWALRRKVGAVEGRRLAGLLVGSVVASAFAGLLGWLAGTGFRLALSHFVRQQNLLAGSQVLVGAAVLVAVYLAACRMLGLEETKYALSMIAKRFARK